MQSRFFKKIWPRFFFHKHSVHLDSFYTFSDYRQIWGLCISIFVIFSVVPLILATMVHYKLIQQTVDSELMLRAERLTSNAKRSISYFIDERLDALTFIVNEMRYENLSDKNKLNEIFSNLKFGFGGYTDLSLIDQSGKQIAYAGLYNLEGKDYKDQSWFTESMNKVNFVSDIFTGYRDAPHIIIAVRSMSPEGAHFILRATLDIERLRRMLSSYKNDEHTDIFLVNHEGRLQTPSSNFGNVFEKLPFPLPTYSEKTRVEKSPDSKESEKTVITGYSYIKTEKVETPFILMVRKEKEGVMSSWLSMGRNFNWIIGGSVVAIIIITLILSSFMVNKLYLADETKAQTMLQMEQSQQLASIGQLAAGVAHEINNPLAQINETAGYIKDLYTFGLEDSTEEEIIEYLDEILDSVERCGTITSQLLGFVRQFDIKSRKIDLEKLINGVLNFHKKEAEYRNIHVSTIYPDLPVILETDSGKLQQILVNLINNAFQALEDDGYLDICVNPITSDEIEVVIKDTGCGIPKENINRLHEPFFSTRKEKMGNGLGLSITYGLVKKLQGRISVESSEGVGTTFKITLPAKLQRGDLA